MNVRIYYDKYGQIVSIIEMKSDSEGPRAGIFPIADCESFDLRLTAEQAKQPLIQLHSTHTLDLTGKKPRLIPIKKDGQD